MNLKLDLRNRAPAIEMLPDSRLRVTREYDVINFNPGVVSEADLLAAVWEGWGAADEKYPDCLLVDQKITGQNGLPYTTPNAEPPRLVRVFEVISRPAEQQVGQTDIAIDENNIVSAVNTFLQFSNTTPVYGKVGVDTIDLSGVFFAGTTTVAVLKSDSRTDDGRLRTIKREYITSGELWRDEQTKSNGAITIKTVSSVLTVPTVFNAGTTTWALIDKKTEHTNGVPVYTYSWANGFGEVGRTTELKNNANLQLITIRYLTPSSVVTQPTVDPFSGAGTIVNTTRQDEDGYALWSVVWAKGSGEISRGTEYRNSTDQGVTGLTVVTIRYLSASSVAANPIASPGVGYALVRDEHEDQDGYRIWTAVYGKGAGTIISEDVTRENGKLKIYTRTALGGPPATPASTIGGMVTPIRTEQRRDRFHEGTIIYDYAFAEGVGEISRTFTAQDQGTVDFDPANPDALNPGVVHCEIRYITAGTTTIDPTSNPTSRFYKVSSSYQEQEGYRIWNSRYAFGQGVIAIERVPREGALLEYRQTVLCAGSTAVPALYRPVTGAILVRRTFVNDSGFDRMDLTWMLRSDENALPAGTSVLTFGIKHPFDYPGRAKLYFATVTANGFSGIAYDVYKSPPIRQNIDATIDIRYQTSSAMGSLPYTFWNPQDWVVIYASWEGWYERIRSEVIPLPGYMIAGTSTITVATGDPSGYRRSLMGERLYPSSVGTIQLAGGPATPEGQTLVIGEPELVPAFYDIENHQQWYRRTVIYATIPTLPALPV